MAAEFPDRLVSEHLILHRYGAHHALALLQLIEGNREQLLESFPNLAKPLRTLADADEYLAAEADHWRTGTRCVYGVSGKASGELVGQLTLKNFDWEVAACEVSYFIGAAFQRRGFALEAVRVAIEAAFTRIRIKKIQARVVVSNAPSQALLQRAGFEVEGRQQRAFRCGRGLLHDVDCYSRIATDGK